MKHFESPKETVIYGGAFNPPTRAHRAILQACIDYAEPRGADVWLLPSGDRTDKPIEATAERRLEMLRALTQDVVLRTVSVGIETSELFRTGHTETDDTVQELQQRFPDRALTWVFGADSIADMPNWKNGQQLRDNLHMLAIDRGSASQEDYGLNVTRLEIPDMEVSSTQLRARISAGEDYEDLVTPAVFAYLRS